MWHIRGIHYLSVCATSEAYTFMVYLMSTLFVCLWYIYLLVESEAYTCLLVEYLRHTRVFLWYIWIQPTRLEIAWSDLWDRINTFYYNLYITLKHWRSCDVLFKESNFSFRKENGLIPLSSQPSGLNFCVFFLFLLF